MKVFDLDEFAALDTPLTEESAYLNDLRITLEKTVRDASLTAEAKVAKLFEFVDGAGTDREKGVLFIVELLRRKGWTGITAQSLENVYFEVRNDEKRRQCVWFKCSQCSVSYPEQKFPCTMCGEAFTHRLLLRLHVSREHNVKSGPESEQYKCMKCKVDFGTSILMMINHVMARHWCRGKHHRHCPVGCRELLNESQSLEHHISNSHTCSECNELTVDIERHAVLFHEPSFKGTQELIVSRKMKRFENGSNACEKKDSSSGRLKALKRNRTDMRRNESPYASGRKFKLLTRCTDKPCVFCRFCSYHIPIEGFSCKLKGCFEKFDYYAEMLWHMRQTHIRDLEVDVKCEVCDVEMALPQMMEHLWNCHECLSAHLRCPLDCLQLFESDLEVVEHLKRDHGVFTSLWTSVQNPTSEPEIVNRSAIFDSDCEKLSKIVEDNDSCEAVEVLDDSEDEDDASVVEVGSQPPKSREPSNERSPLNIVDIDLESISPSLDINHNLIGGSFSKDSLCSSAKKRMLKKSDEQPSESVERNWRKLFKDAEPISLGLAEYRVFMLNDVAPVSQDWPLLLTCSVCQFQYPRWLISCKRCDEKFCTATSLRYHEEDCHGLVHESIICGCCAQEFVSTKAMLSHELTNACQSHFQCPFGCGHLYGSVEEIAFHIETMHPSFGTASSVHYIDSESEIVEIITPSQKLRTKCRRLNNRKAKNWSNKHLGVRLSNQIGRSKSSVQKKKKAISVPFYESVKFFDIKAPLNGKLTSSCKDCCKVKPKKQYYQCKLCKRSALKSVENSRFVLMAEAAYHLIQKHKINISGVSKQCDCQPRKKNKGAFKLTSIESFYKHAVRFHGLCRQHYVCSSGCGAVFNSPKKHLQHVSNVHCGEKKKKEN